jgi:hypothetical protein
MRKPKINRWQIKCDDETGPDQAALQIIRNDKVLAWLMLSPEQLDELIAGAAQMATALRMRR